MMPRIWRLFKAWTETVQEMLVDHDKRIEELERRVSSSSQKDGEASKESLDTPQKTPDDLHIHLNDHCQRSFNKGKLEGLKRALEIELKSHECTSTCATKIGLEKEIKKLEGDV